MLQKLFALALAGAITISGLGVLAPGADAAATAAAPAPLQPHIIGDKIRTFAAGDGWVLYQKEQSQDLIRHDLSTGSETVIAAGAQPGRMLTEEPYIAFSHGTPGKESLVLHHLESGQQQTLTTGATLISLAGFADGKLVWSQRDASYDRVFTRFDTATGRTEELYRGPWQTGMYNYAGYDGKDLIWVESDYTMATGSERNKIIFVELATGERREYRSASILAPGGFANGRVLFAAYPEQWANQDEVRVWEPMTGRDERLAARTHDWSDWRYGYHPAIDGDRGIWTEGETITVADLKSGSARTIQTADAGQRLQPLLTGRYVVYRLGIRNHTSQPLHAVPVDLADGQPSQPLQQVYHEVQPGDILWRIALKYGVGLHDLIRANNLLDPGRIYPGERLFLPHPVSAPYEPYVIRWGDTLQSLAVRFGTSTGHIIALNERARYGGLYPNEALLMPRGTEKICPAEGPCYQTYAVMPGDTLWKISQRSGTAMGALVQFNKLERRPDELYVGQTLIIRQ